MAVNYPTGKKTAQKTVNRANLGMTLESDIELTNQYYLEKNIAVIYKKPTPVQVVSVSYPARNKAKIVEAYYKTPSTTDFNGIYKGYYIDFDAKETKSKTSIPLKNIHAHQIEHLKRITDQGGIGFLIVYFQSYDEYYYLPFDVLYDHYLESLKGGRQSIPYTAFQDEGYPIKFGFNPRLDYLRVIDTFVIPGLKQSHYCFTNK
ncbi:MAG: Holliday junction resolvase RecU [Acholeplasma sp.]|nr:Holliday junction resolvase RecU [Acholeplasma sp.]